MKKIAWALICGALGALGVGFLLSATLIGCASAVTVDDASPHVVSASVSAGSGGDEASQYVEARFVFDSPVEAAGGADAVASDFAVKLNGEAPDEQTVRVEAAVEGSEVAVRLVPADGADGSDASVYFAVYDGLVDVAAASEDGALAHVKAAGGSSNAVMDASLEFTVPSGVQVAQVDAGAGDAAAGEPAWVTFDFTQYAQLRSCTWLSFGDGLPAVMIHNHEYARDLPETVADRFVQTVTTDYADVLSAEADGARVTVRAAQAIDGQALSVRICEGIGANPAAGVCGTGALTAVCEGGTWVVDDGGAQAAGSDAGVADGASSDGGGSAGAEGGAA